MTTPVLPRITLRNGAHVVEVIDPRPDPMTLGARYVHGGYIYAWSVAGRTLTSGPGSSWSSFGGCGLPETFELPLMRDAAAENGTYMRIGAGQLRKHGATGEESDAVEPLTATVDWTIVSQSDTHITMRTRDMAEGPGWLVAYTLERTVRVHEDGVESTTTLGLESPPFAQHPISWFAHPFFAQTALGASAITIPDATIINRTRRPMSRFGFAPGNLIKGEVDDWRFSGPGSNRATIGGLWGTTPTLRVALDPALGGGQVSLQLDRPLDHLVVWAGETVFSPEPKLCRLWLDGEVASWSLRYRFAPA